MWVDAGLWEPRKPGVEPQQARAQVGKFFSFRRLTILNAPSWRWPRLPWPRAGSRVWPTDEGLPCVTHPLLGKRLNRSFLAELHKWTPTIVGLPFAPCQLRISRSVTKVSCDNTEQPSWEGHRANTQLSFYQSFGSQKRGLRSVAWGCVGMTGGVGARPLAPVGSPLPPSLLASFASSVTHESSTFINVNVLPLATLNPSLLCGKAPS